MIYINILLITLIIVFIIDLSGFTQSVQNALKRWLRLKTEPVIKPFMCSLCMTWWTALIYIIATHNFTIPLIAYSALLAFLTPVFRDIIKLVQDFIISVINAIYTYFNL